MMTQDHLLVVLIHKYQWRFVASHFGLMHLFVLTNVDCVEQVFVDGEGAFVVQFTQGARWVLFNLYH